MTQFKKIVKTMASMSKEINFLIQLFKGIWTTLSLIRNTISKNKFWIK